MVGDDCNIAENGSETVVQESAGSNAYRRYWSHEVCIYWKAAMDCYMYHKAASLIDGQNDFIVFPDTW